MDKTTVWYSADLDCIIILTDEEFSHVGCLVPDKWDFYLGEL